MSFNVVDKFSATEKKWYFFRDKVLWVGLRSEFRVSDRIRVYSGVLSNFLYFPSHNTGSTRGPNQLSHFDTLS